MATKISAYSSTAIAIFMHLTESNIRKQMSPHPKDGNNTGFLCKHKILIETLALQCSTFLITL